MARIIHTFDEASLRKLKEDHDKLERQVRQLVYQLSRRAHVHLAHTRLRAFRFRNDANESVPRRGVMKPTGGARYQGRAVRTVAKPDANFQSRYLVNLESRVAAGGYGWGTWLDEDGEVLYDSGSGPPAYGEEWGVKSGEWALFPNRPGFWIVSGNDTTAKLTTAAQDFQVELIGKTAGITKGNTGTFTIWAGASGSEAATELTVTVRALTADLGNGKWTSAGRRNGVWYAAPLECA